MKVPSNKISDLIRYYSKELEGIYGNAESKSLLYILLEHFFDLNRLDIVKDEDIRLSESELLKIHFAVKDLMKQKPVQHIIGKETFYGLDFIVSKDVLIPRPETEELVDMIIKKSISENKSISILDIGTGSGCIAISLQKNISNSIVHAIDVSENALKIANENARLNQSKIAFSKIDILSIEESKSLPIFDVIVSNPPYVRNSEKALMQKNVIDFDPELALFVEDDDPLLFYRSIAIFAQTHLSRNGQLYFEINEAFGLETIKLLESLTYCGISLHKDFRGKDRFLSAKLSEK